MDYRVMILLLDLERVSEQTECRSTNILKEVGQRLSGHIS